MGTVHFKAPTLGEGSMFQIILPSNTNDGQMCNGDYVVSKLRTLPGDEEPNWRTLIKLVLEKQFISLLRKTDAIKPSDEQVKRIFILNRKDSCEENLIIGFHCVALSLALPVIPLEILMKQLPIFLITKEKFIIYKYADELLA